jgi:hypothetical protein
MAGAHQTGHLGLGPGLLGGRDRVAVGQALHE